MQLHYFVLHSCVWGMQHSVVRMQSCSYHLHALFRVISCAWSRVPVKYIDRQMFEVQMME